MARIHESWGFTGLIDGASRFFTGNPLNWENFMGIKVFLNGGASFIAFGVFIWGGFRLFQIAKESGKNKTVSIGDMLELLGYVLVLFLLLTDVLGLLFQSTGETIIQ